MRVLRRFRVVFNAVRTHFQQIEKELGLGGAQAWALSVVHQQPGIGVSELARSMDVHQSTASNLVRQLLARGLVATSPHESDGRAVRLSVLPDGLKLLGRWAGPYAGVLPMALEALDDETLARLDQDLGRLIDSLAVDDAAAGKPMADL